MLVKSIPTTKRLGTAILAGIIVFISLAGILCLSKTTMSQVLMMFDCPLMGADAAMCPMKVLDHLTNWRAMFVAIPVAEMLLLASLFITAFFLKKITLTGTPPDSAIRLRQRDFRDWPLFDYLPKLFARGILHPKICA